MGNRLAVILVTAFLVACQGAATDEMIDTAAIESEVLRVAEDALLAWEQQADAGTVTAGWSQALGTPWAGWDDRAAAEAGYDAQWAQYDYTRVGDAQWQVNVHAPNVASAIARVRYLRTDTTGAEVTQNMTFKQVFVLEDGVWKVLLADAVFVSAGG